MSDWVSGGIVSASDNAGAITLSYWASMSAWVAKTTPAAALAAILALQSSESCRYSITLVRAASAASLASPAALTALLMAVVASSMSLSSTPI